MSGYEPLIRWDSGDRQAHASCRHCVWKGSPTNIASVRMHILANPTHRVTVITTATMEFRHGLARTTAHA